MQGYSVLTADNGPVGLRLLAENPVDIIVFDYVMPDMDGLAVAAAIRERHGRIPVARFYREVPSLSGFPTHQLTLLSPLSLASALPDGGYRLADGDMG